MRAIPWLISLLLHMLVLCGIAALSRTPSSLPRPLVLDFQIIPAELSSNISAVDADPEPLPPPAPAEPPAPRKISAKNSGTVTPRPSVKPVARVETTEPTVAEVMESQSDAVKPSVQAALPSTVPQSGDAAAEAKARDDAMAVAIEARTISRVRAQVLGRLNYPALARRKGWCGKLVLGFVLCVDGSIEDLQVLESSSYRILDQAALQAVEASAPFDSGHPRTAVRLPINFQLN